MTRTPIDAPGGPTVTDDGAAPVQFAWRNGRGEHECTRFDRVMQDYWAHVAAPALASAEQEAQRWLDASDADLSALFIHAEKVDQHLVTAFGMALSLQSIWERQLRRYLVACAGQDPALVHKIQMAPWLQLQEHFAQLRGVPLQAFITFAELDLLSVLGNVCRHGNGKSADGLWRAHPDLWPYSEGQGNGPTPAVEHMHIPTRLLARLADGVVQFWSFIDYLYTENLQSKHASVERDLPGLRRRHAAAIAHFNSTVAVPGA